MDERAKGQTLPFPCATVSTAGEEPERSRLQDRGDEFIAVLDSLQSCHPEMDKQVKTDWQKQVHLPVSGCSHHPNGTNNSCE